MHYHWATMNTRLIDDIAERLQRALPAAPEDVRKNVRAAVQAALERLDLVTREELEIQEAVLARTRARLEEMEKRVAELEARLLKK